MSTLKVDGIRSNSASSDAITLASDGTCTANITNRTNRNLIINGACVIDQRNDGSSVTSGYAIDRTHIEGFSGGGTGTAQRVTDSPSGFTHSLKVTVTGTDTSLAASDFYTLRHIIEGTDIAHLGFGASGGTSVTLSFWVKSSVTGTFCAGLGNGSNNRTMPKEYTISSANTWEKKTLTFPADTTGTWGTDANRGFSIRWCMGAGSTRTATADTYNASEAHATSNQTNLFATNGATFQITGMQLEAGTIATDFEHRSYGDELLRCKRYYVEMGRVFSGESGYVLNGLQAYGTQHLFGTLAQLPVTMRAKPTCTVVGTISFSDKAGSNTHAPSSTLTVNKSSPNWIGVSGASFGSSHFIQGGFAFTYATPDGTNYIKVDAEL